MPRSRAANEVVKRAAAPNKSDQLLDDASADELREKLMDQLRHLVSRGVIDLKDLAVPESEIANQPISAVDQFGINGKRSSELCRSVPRSAARCVK
jgi:hypothetical protein